MEYQMNMADAVEQFNHAFLGQYDIAFSWWRIFFSIDEQGAVFDQTLTDTSQLLER